MYGCCFGHILGKFVPHILPQEGKKKKQKEQEDENIKESAAKADGVSATAASVT